ncbi:hypothetical protein PJF56_19835 [Roseofilum sp. BLCC_M91]|uniref:Uncharacterized protein n=1 Tax=Roseofilum halophilum BLCC-M91 TaxID=3022259 RepID=A0ABT7BPW1_9CYAN|nr:hypothetical protein [Roseofilum halophilum]MDJ1181115.1 hypothetical protein [Roseofilum halophilum BLCC-M91]
MAASKMLALPPFPHSSYGSEQDARTPYSSYGSEQDARTPPIPPFPLWQRARCSHSPHSPIPSYGSEQHSRTPPSPIN